MRPSVMGVARSLVAANVLQRFITTVATGNGNEPTGFRYLPQAVRSKLNDQLKRRQVPDFLRVPIETVQFPEMINLAARRFRFSDLNRHHIWEWTERRFDRTVANRWAGTAPCLYGCEHASVETFRKQKELGGYNILWQVIAHHKTMSELLHEESEQFPESITSYQRELLNSLPRINARKDRQYADADLIITNSEFSRETFLSAGVPAEKIKAIPTGCPPVTSRNLAEDQARPMIFLSAGSQSLRKGTPYLLEAWKTLRPVAAELWLVGEMQLPERMLSDLPESISVHPPVPAHDLERIFTRASVLVLPTLGEGLAHILLEALSAGLAIITTENSGCGNLVEDGVNGWQIPIRDSELLADRIAWCIEHPAEVRELQRQSQLKAAEWQEEDFVHAHATVVWNFLAEKGISLPHSVRQPA